MTNEELEEQLSSATRVDEYEFRDEQDEDNYFAAALYKTEDNRHFRVVEYSGYNSKFDAAGNIGEWLTEEEAENWTEF